MGKEHTQYTENYYILARIVENHILGDFFDGNLKEENIQNYSKSQDKKSNFEVLD